MPRSRRVRRKQLAMGSFRFGPSLLAIWAFFFTSAVAGQIIYHGQGDTPAISFRYGLLYMLYGVFGAIRGEYPFVASFSCQLVAAGLFYWLGHRNARLGWLVAAALMAGSIVWLLVMSPQIFV